MPALIFILVAFFAALAATIMVVHATVIRKLKEEINALNTKLEDQKYEYRTQLEQLICERDVYRERVRKMDGELWKIYRERGYFQSSYQELHKKMADALDKELRAHEWAEWETVANSVFGKYMEGKFYK